MSRSTSKSVCRSNTNADIRTVHPSWSIKGLLMKCEPGSSYALTVLLARALDTSAKMRVLLALKPGTAKCPCGDDCSLLKLELV